MNAAMHLPTPIIPMIVPMPTPTSPPLNNRPTMHVRATLEKSMKFLPNPRFLRKLHQLFCRPSAGFGIRSIEIIIDAPTPVMATATTSRIPLKRNDPA
ncbi:MAG: hypothetical protein V8R14_03295 [Clostridia bacterium]